MNGKTPLFTIPLTISIFIIISGCITDNPGYSKIEIQNEIIINGIYDPSVEYDENGIGWMTYSYVDAPEYVHTHLAKSEDQGETWEHVNIINTAFNDSITLQNGSTIHGVWRHEVSTLVHDPNDQGKEWKLFWHKYFTKPPFQTEDRMFQYGWIAYRHASHPKGPWSEEIALFGAGIFPPESFETVIDLSLLHQDLKNCIVYSEPGSLIKDQTLYISLNAHTIKLGKNIGMIILLSSEDHGKTWNYINTLLQPNHAQRIHDFTCDYFTGSSLVEENKRIFLFATPEDVHSKYMHHRGTYIFEFKNLSQGTLQTSEKNLPRVIKYLPLSLISGGQSDYDEQNIHGGIIMPQWNLSAIPELFQIFNTKEPIISEN
jgi:hypothetical protein